MRLPTVVYQLVELLWLAALRVLAKLFWQFSFSIWELNVLIALESL